MPLALFNCVEPSYFSEATGLADGFGHTFGGSLKSFGISYRNVIQRPNLFARLARAIGIPFADVKLPIHLLYRINLADPALDVELPGVTWLPLVYGFSFHVYQGEFLYRVVNDSEIELLTSLDSSWEPEYPYEAYPATFSRCPISFAKQEYDPAVAEDALSLQAIFGLEDLSSTELQRAVEIGLSNGSYVSYSQDDVDPEWNDEDILRCFGRAPFIQGPPPGSCSNPDCSAEVAGHVEGMELDLTDIPPDDPMAQQAAAMGMDLGEIVREYYGTDILQIDGHDVRENTMRVIAIHEPEPEGTVMRGDPFHQLIFEFCDCCHCIRVTNQCT